MQAGLAVTPLEWTVVMNHDTARSLTLLAGRQDGLVTTAQIQEVGYTHTGWRHQIDIGAWERVSTRVARRTGTRVTPHQRLVAAVLDAGPSAYVSHRSAAGLWGLPGFRPEPIELIVVRGGRERASELATIHRPRHLPDPFSAVIDGVPVVRPSLLMLQLAPLVSVERLGRLLDHLWSRRLVSGRSLRTELEPLLHRGRAGTVAMRTVLEVRSEDYVPPASALEGRFAALLEQAGLKAMRRQVDVGDGEHWCGRVDFLDVDLPLVVEIDSERYHGSLSSVADDRAREERIVRGGFTVLRLTEFQVWHRAREVTESVVATRAQLQRWAA